MQSIQSDQVMGERPASWVAVASLAVGSFALVTAEFLPVGLLPAIATDIGISHGQAGLAMTVPGIVAAIAAPLTISIAGGTDRRKVLWILLALLIASNFIVAASTSLTQLIIGRVLLGIAVGSFWTVAGALGPRLRPGPEGIRASALILSGVSIGTVAGVPAGALIGEVMGWRVAFGAAALLSGIAIAAVLTLLPPIPTEKQARRSSLWSLLSMKSARLGLIIAALVFVSQFAAYTYITPFLNERSGISNGLLTMVLLANGVAGFLGNLAGGWLASRNARKAVITTSTLLGGSVLLLALTGTYPLMAVLLVVMWGFGFGMLPIAMQTWLFNKVPGQVESMQALFVTVAQAAIGAGALIGGLIVDHANVTSALLAGGVIALSTALVLTFTNRNHALAHEQD